jgi:hypothetical protein
MHNFSSLQKYFLSSFVTLLIHFSGAARIDSINEANSRQIRQNYRGNYRYQLPAYLSPDANARTIYSTDRRDSDGSFSYSYETDNAIKAKQESTGYGANKVVRGYYSYIGSDGVPYTVNYIADRFGYRAYGAHLPTQPDEIYDQTKLPVYRPSKNPYYVAPTPIPAQVYPVQSQPSYYPQGSLSTQPIYVSDSSAPQNYIHITPKPFENSFPTSTPPPVSILPPYANQYSNQPYAWTTPRPLAINPGYSSSTARPYISYK